MRDFRQLDIWKKSHVLTLKIYSITKSFPHEELYGITSQIRRACSSIPTNIAEGCGRIGSAEFKRFLRIALGSTNERDYLIQLAVDIVYIDENEGIKLFDEIKTIKQMLKSLIKKICDEKK